MSFGYVINSFVGLQNYRVIKWKRYRKRRIDIWLEPGQRCYQCPVCKRKSRPYGMCWSRLRDLNIGPHEVWLWVLRRRIVCRRCGIRRILLSIARPRARCTRRFEYWLFELTEDMNLLRVSRLIGTDWKTVKDAEVRHILGLLRKRDLEGITDLGIDEVAAKKGHHYLTLVSDLAKRRVIWVGKGRDRTVLGKFFRWLGKNRTRRLKSVVIDMHDPYELEIRARCPRAKIIYDHFHVIKPLSMAIDNIRRRLQAQRSPKERSVLKGSRYLLLRPREDLTGSQRVRLKDLLEFPANQTLQTAYLLKEDLRAVFRLLSPKQARTELRDWKRRARESGIPEILDYVKMLDRRRFGILNFFKFRNTNGLSEGFNNVVKTIKKNAYGFHDWQYFRLKILRKCGKLRDI